LNVTSDLEAKADSNTTDEDHDLTVAIPGVLGNDTGDGITVTAFDKTSAKGATVVVNPNGFYSYDPTTAAAIQALGAGETSTDSFNYTIKDSRNATASAQVTINLTGVNDAPETTPIIVAEATNEDVTGFTVNLLQGATDADAGAVLNVRNIITTSEENSTRVINTSVRNGELSIDLNQFNDLAAGDSETINVNYEIFDGTVTKSNTATFTVQGRYDAPLAVNDAFNSTEDNLLNILAPGVLGNDIGNDLQVTISDDYSLNDAKVMVNPDGSFSYDPKLSKIIQALDVGDTLPDSFQYTIEDLEEGLTSQGEVTINLTGINDAPNAKNDPVNPAGEDNLLNLKVLANDTDPEDHPLTVTTVRATSDKGAKLTVKPNGSIDYDPTAAVTIQALKTGQTLTDKFIYNVSDGKGGTDQARTTIQLTGSNDAPKTSVINGVPTNEDAANPFTVNLLSTATDPEGDSLTVGDAVATSSNDKRQFLTTVKDGVLSLDPSQYNDGVEPRYV
jgi:large repetitive protein